MGQTKTTIELNGKLYDATTGVMVSGGQPAAPKPIAPAYKKPVSKGVTMDGFIRRPTPVHKAAAPKPQATVTRSKANRAGHSTQPSKTLMRHAVSKPAPSHKITGKATPAESKAHHVPAPSQTLHTRKARAAQIGQSSSISRFSHNTQKTVVEKKYQPLAVQPHPQDAHNIAASASKASDSFSAALQNATSHQAAPIKASKRRHRAAKKLGVSVRAFNIGAVSLAVVLLTGFIAYQNVPNVSMRMASSKAGFNASLPGYTPSGFGMSRSISSSPGAVTVSFRSHSDQRNFEVSQKPSNWTSDSLLSNHVAVGQRSYQTYQDKGKTIYIYDGDKASWVNGGVWYEISGNANLSSEQLLRIADSM